MRVIAGKCRHMPLATISGMDTRPTTDRIKETLFNMLFPYLNRCHFLDLFAGSGQIGIEALSRGAERAVFVEKNPKAVACIRKNLEFTRLTNQAEILVQDAEAACRKLNDCSVEDPKAAFDVIFMDPPYDRQLEQRLLVLLSDSALLSQEGIIVVEASIETDFSYVTDLGFIMERQKKYKTNQHVFLRRG